MTRSRVTPGRPKYGKVHLASAERSRIVCSFELSEDPRSLDPRAHLEREVRGGIRPASARLWAVGALAFNSPVESSDRVCSARLADSRKVEEEDVELMLADLRTIRRYVSVCSRRRDINAIGEPPTPV